MKNKGELNFVLKYEKSDNSISTYTEDGKFIYKNISLSDTDTLEYSNGVKVKISERNGKLKPFIEANISNGEAKFYEGSKLREIAHYKNNTLDGEALEFNEKGEVIRRWYYKDGVEIKK